MKNLEKIQDIIEDFEEAKRKKVDWNNEDLNTKFEEMRDAYLGQQWNKIKVNRNKPDPTVNVLASTIEQEVANLSLQNPTIMVSPVEKTDLENASAIETAIQFVLKRNKITHKTQMYWRDGLNLGTGIAKLNWNPEYLKYETQLSPRLGEVVIDIIDPLNFYPDPYAVEDKDWMYVNASYYRSKRYVEEFYDVKFEDQKARDVTVTESWYKPTNKHPAGRYVVWTSEFVLKDEDNPYGFLPFYPLFNRKLSSSFWGISEIEAIYEIQQWLNVVLGYILVNIKYGSQFKIWSDDPNLKNAKLDMDPQKMINLTRGSKVGVLMHQGLAPEWFNLYKTLEQGIQSVSGVHDIMYGSTSGGVTAASAIQTLKASGQIRMSLRTQNMKETMDSMAQGIVRLMKQYYDDKRWYRILGTEQFKGFDPKKVSEYYDINFSYGDALPEDKMGKLNMAMAVANMPPQAQVILMKLLNDPTITALLSSGQAQAATTAVQQAQPAQGGQQVPPDLAKIVGELQGGQGG